MIISYQKENIYLNRFLLLDLTRIGCPEEHPQQSFETYVKRIPDLLAAAVETNWDRHALCAVSVSNIVTISDLQW